VSAILHDLPLEEVLRFAAAEKFDAVELMSWPPGKADRKYAGVTHVDATDFTRARADDVRALAAKHGVAISGLGYYPNPLSGDAELSARSIAHLKQVIHAAEVLDLRLVNTFIGADHRLHPEENLARFRAVWPDIVRFAEDHGCRIAIENCPMLFTRDEWPAGKNLATSPAVWRRMFEAIPSPSFGLNFDPSHLVWQFIDIAGALREFRERLFHVHAKDLKVDRRKLGAEGILALGWAIPKIPGHGDVDWGEFFSGLSEAGYAGAVCIEVEDEAFGKTLEGRKRALRIARNLLEPYFARSPEESP
jgi:sugar phosphate isomerase/epimerase